MVVKQDNAKRKEQIISLAVGNNTIDFFKVNSTNKGLYLIPLQKFTKNKDGKGSGLHFSLHYNTDFIFLKSYSPLITLKTLKLEELKRKIPVIFEKLVSLPSTNQELKITVIKLDDHPTYMEGKRTMINIDGFEDSAIKTVNLPNSDNLKEELIQLEQDDKTKGYIKYIECGKSEFYIFIPAIPEKIATIKREYLTEKTLKIIEDYGGVIISLNEEIIKDVFKEIGVKPEDLEKLFSQATAGSNDVADKLNKMISDNIVTLSEELPIGENLTREEFIEEYNIKSSENDLDVKS